MTRDLLTSIAIWKWHSSKDVLSFLELISSNYFKIWMNFNYSLVLTNNPFYQYLLTTVFLKSKQRFFSVSWKRISKTYLFNFIYLFMFGWPWFEPDVCQGSWGKMTLQGYEKFITIKYQVMNNKQVHYFVHYMTASFKMLHVFFLQWELIIKVLIDILLLIQELLEG